MTGVLVATLAVAGCVVLLQPPRGPGARRLRAMRPQPPRPSARELRDFRLLAGCVAGAGLALVVGGPVGVGVGLVAGVVTHRVFGTLESRGEQADRARVLAELPLTLDLISSCLSGGAPLVSAITTVAAATGGPIARTFEPVASALHLGASPPQAWSRLRGVPELEQVARAAIRTADSGATLAQVLTRLAQQLRAAQRAAATARARRSGIAAVGPLAACFLPAFLLVGVAPVVVGLIQDILTQLR